MEPKSNDTVLEKMQTKKGTFTYHQKEAMEISRALNEEMSWKI